MGLACSQLQCLKHSCRVDSDQPARHYQEQVSPIQKQQQVAATELTAWCMIKIDPTCSEWPLFGGGTGGEAAAAGASAGVGVTWQCPSCILGWE